MTTTSTTNKSRTTGNGVTVVFPATIKIFAATDIVVTTINNTTDALINTLILNDGGALGFTVVFDTDAETLTVTVNTAPLATEDLQILRSLAQTQTTDLPLATKFPSVTVENALDKNTMILQDQQEVLDRTAKLPEESSVSSVVLPTPVARKALVWTAAADGTIENSTFDPDQAQADSAASAAAAAVSETNAAADAILTAADVVTTNADVVLADQAVIDAQAAAGAVKVSSNDTTAGDLEAKILSSGLVGLSTQNDGGNETRTIDVPKANQATAEAGTNDTDAMTSLGTSQAIAAQTTTLVSGTAVVTTSGTAFDFTSLPSGIKQIIISFSGVSLSGTDDFLVQLGDSGGIETASYFSVASRLTGTVVTKSSTAGFIVDSSLGTSTLSGSIILSLVDGSTNTWACEGNMAREVAAAATILFAGQKSLSAELTQLRITRTGTDTFDAGKINILHE